MSFLDQICDNHSSPVRIISENHNVGSINWVQGMSDPGEMISCGAYQELRRHDGESDETYAARLTILLQTLPADVRAKIETAARMAAIGRASLDATGGKVRLMVAGKAPWHQLGVNVESAVDSANAMSLSGTDIQMDKTTLQYIDATGTIRTYSDAYAIVRRDTGEAMNAKSVGKTYKVMQNREMFDLMDTVLKDYGARYETAGSLYNGSKVFMSVKLPNQSFVINGGDVQEAYGVFVGVHDGSGCNVCFPTSHRPVCANTLRMAMGADSSKGIRIRHAGDMKAKVKEAQRVLGLTIKSFDEYKESANALYAKPMLDRSGREYFDSVLDETCELTAEQSKMGALALAHIVAKDSAETPGLDSLVKSFEKQIAKRENILADICERYESERCGIGSIRGTYWAGLQAVTEFADHGKIGKESRDDTTRNSRRFESVIAGDRDEMKQVAYNLALKA